MASVVPAPLSDGSSGISTTAVETLPKNITSPASVPVLHAPSKPAPLEIKNILAQFDSQINQMMDYPAKDIINSLTMAAEKFEFAQEIVQFLETKIHRVSPNFKLPIFYLMDSILKNVKGPYPKLFGEHIVPLYCNCVRQVTPKDLRRFVHVLNTWEASQLFVPGALGQMRSAATRALAQVEPSKIAHVPLSFSQERQSVDPVPSFQSKIESTNYDLELRVILTQLQNDMGIHPTKHMSLEQVRSDNPEYYQQLQEYHTASKNKAAEVKVIESVPERSVQYETQTREGGRIPHSSKRKGRNKRMERVRMPQSYRENQSKNSMNHPTPPIPSSGEASRSANVAHLMKLLKTKRRSPSPAPSSQQEDKAIAKDNPRASTTTSSSSSSRQTKGGPDPAAVMSILKRLRGLSGSKGGKASAGRADSSSLQEQTRQVTRDTTAKNDVRSSKMWFSDKIVAHKDRVESNIQKLYAALPLVCRESGVRFREQKKLDAHLDFLFQYNRSVKERGKGGISRAWYPNKEQWTTDFSTDHTARKNTSSSFFDQDSKKMQDDKEDQVLMELRNARVPVDESVTKCRICGEPFEKCWDEDEEEWMYINAIVGSVHAHDEGNVKSTIFHKYCYDTVLSNSKCITWEHLIPEAAADEVEETDDDDIESKKRIRDEVECELPSDEEDSDEDVKRPRAE
uniref:Uncharacterized protein AlNc14C26G2558 n=1 Tax=Albugo laibachii Nc14 TaxID=890382 RepID=F0W6S2_9STRA|nr:conserved hypothetical protein [Albugo laibachii Nc14]|eukprot:CCA16817.1 conserved hypothetical protein [Albugo laibachii Nc14]